MRSIPPSRLAVLVLLSSGMAACRTARREGPPSSAPQAAVRSADEADRVALEKARSDSARYPYTSADIRFMSGMIGHHAQAIEMSRLAPNNGAGASVRTLAERIINAQQDEITIMRQWLRDRRQPVPEIHPTAMMSHHGDHSMMPGMLTPAQMKQLEEAKGQEFDRLFLTLMIQHHRGAIGMVKELFATPAAGEDLTVFKVATDVNVDQTTEVARMGQMLSALLFERRPP